MTNNSKPLSKILLTLLAATGQATINYITFFYDLKKYRWKYVWGGKSYVNEIKRFQHKAQADAALNSLRRSQYITTQKIGQRLAIKLTTKGYLATLSDQLKNRLPLPNGVYTVVIFDIPESQYLVRRRFRWLLRQGGFIKLQQSVWISRQDSYDELKKFIKQLKLESWVNIFRANKLLCEPPK